MRLVFKHLGSNSHNTNSEKYMTGRENLDADLVTTQVGWISEGERFIVARSFFTGELKFFVQKLEK